MSENENNEHENADAENADAETAGNAGTAEDHPHQPVVEGEAPAAQSVPPAPYEPVAASGPCAWSNRARAVAGGVVAAAFVVGGGVGYAVGHSGSGSDQSQRPQMGRNGTFPGGEGGFGGPGGQGQQGGQQGGPGGFGQQNQQGGTTDGSTQSQNQSS